MKILSPMLSFSLFGLFLILFTDSILAQTMNTMGCDKFYKKTNFKVKSLDKKVVLAVTDINEYSFRIVYEDGPGIKKSVDLYTNVNGKRLRTYLQPGDMIRKTKDDFYISVARIINKNMDIKRFNTSCD